MAGIKLLLLFFAVAGSSPTLAEDGVSASSTAALIRVPRTLHEKRLCRKYGICQGFGGYGGNQGGYGGYQEHGGYNQGGYNQGYPINIAISQSQTSANEGYGGNSHGYYPNNHQYNGGYPYRGHGHGYNHGDNHGHGSYGGYRPGFDNGNFAHNNQFNGNYYSGGEHGGYGQRSPFGYGDDYDYDEGQRSVNGVGAYARSSAKASV